MLTQSMHKQKCKFVISLLTLTNITDSMFHQQSLYFCLFIFRAENPCESAFSGDLQVFSWQPTSVQEHDLIASINPPRVKHLLKEQLHARTALRWYLSVKVRFIKFVNNGEEVNTEAFFTSNCHRLLQEYDIHEQVIYSIEKIKNDFENFLREGSGWALDKIQRVYVNICKYKPLKGHSFIELPRKLKSTKAIINIQNTDNKCFIYSVLAALHPVQDAQRVTKYIPFIHELNLSGIDMPMKLQQIPKFEKLNKISVNVFGYDEGVYPLHITSHIHPRHVNLLLISNDVTTHYCLIKDLNKLLYHQSKSKRRKYFCPSCLHGFIRQDLLEQHKPYCQTHTPQRIEMPSEENKWLKFKNFAHQMRVKFCIYADFESMLPKVTTCDPDPGKSNTTPVQKHIPCGFCYKVVCSNERYSKEPVVYCGPDTVKHFLHAMQKEERYILNTLKKVEPMSLTPEDEQAFQAATLCHICDKPLGNDKVRDHDHLQQGHNYRGAAHNACNLNYKPAKFIPVVFHNLRGYDSHIILSGVGKIPGDKISCIPNNMEKYISFSIGSLRFIDSLQFLNASLETLVKNLAQGAVQGHEVSTRFPSLSHQFPDPKQLQLLLGKQIYPYDYIDTPERFLECQLPDIEKFHNTLTDEPLSQSDYEHAQTVWREFNICDMGEYHDLYVLTDVLLLADVFENFRSICLNSYGLDPAHYYTSPGLAWDAMLKMTGVELELLTDPDMHLFIEEGIRGGVSMICKKHSAANNPYIEGYDASKPSIFLSYLDCTNLYGYSMGKPLPQSNFHWATQHEIDTFKLDEISEDSETGYILEVDLEYPNHIHDLHNDYPLAPERLTVTNDMLSPYSKEILRDLNFSLGKTPKLVPNLRDKTKYVVHFRNLKLYMRLGMKLTHIHRILIFKQSPWLKPYIDFNTDKRKQAKNDFEKDFYKLLNNSVYGKTMENLRNHTTVELVTSKERLRKVIAKPNVKLFKIFHENLAAVEVKKSKLILNRPIYVGMSILDISKAHMYDFFYNHLKPKYGENMKLNFTDTDSFCLEIQTPDVYADMKENSDIFDTSNFPTNHFLYSDKNKKIPGKFKDECPNNPPFEFVGLKAKMYSIDLGVTEKKVAKGVNRSVIRRKLKHQMYKDCLLKKRLYTHHMMRIQSNKHQLSTCKMNKISLSPFDDKRYFVSETSSYAYGHFKIDQNR